MRVIRTFYARMLRVNDEYKYASGSVTVHRSELVDFHGVLCTGLEMVGAWTFVQIDGIFPSVFR